MATKIPRHIFYSLCCAILLFACAEPEGFRQPEDPLDTGREFVRAVLNGDYKKATLYLNNDPEDQELFNRYVKYQKKQPTKEKLFLKSASIIINEVEHVNDSTSIINFSNSHTMTPMNLKIIKSDKSWKVDFSYTFSENIPAK